MRVVGMLYSTKRKVPRRQPTTRLLRDRANANNQNMQDLQRKKDKDIAYSRVHFKFSKTVLLNLRWFPATSAPGRSRGKSLISSYPAICDEPH